MSCEVMNVALHATRFCGAGGSEMLQSKGKCIPTMAHLSKPSALEK